MVEKTQSTSWMQIWPASLRLALIMKKWLGNDREQIGFEKAGILRSEQLAVCTDRNLPDSIRSAARELSLKLFVNGEDFLAQVNDFDWSWFANHIGVENGIDSIPLPSIPGNCQQDNSAGAVMVAVFGAEIFEYQ